MDILFDWFDGVFAMVFLPRDPKPVPVRPKSFGVRGEARGLHKVRLHISALPAEGAMLVAIAVIKEPNIKRQVRLADKILMYDSSDGPFDFYGAQVWHCWEHVSSGEPAFMELDIDHHKGFEIERVVAVDRFGEFYDLDQSVIAELNADHNRECEGSGLPRSDWK